MIDVLGAIKTKFNATTALTAIFPSGCYLSQGPDGFVVTDSTPLAIVTYVSGTTNPSTVNNSGQNPSVTDERIQFSVFASQDVAAANALELIRQTFSRQPLTFANSQFISMKRISQQIFRQDEKVWHAFADYQVFTGEPA